MSTRNQVRVAKGILAQTTGAMLAKEIREVFATFDQPEVQNEPCFPTAEGRWLTVAEVKAYFGPNYATNHTVIEQCIAAYAGRLVKAAIEEVGLDVRAISPEQLVMVASATNQAEKDAFVRMTAN